MKDIWLVFNVKLYNLYSRLRRLTLQQDVYRPWNKKLSWTFSSLIRRDDLTCVEVKNSKRCLVGAEFERETEVKNIF